MMKGFIIAGMIGLVTAGVFANGNSERLSSIEGEALIVKESDGSESLSLRLGNGDLVRVQINADDLGKLMIRNQDRVRIDGVFVGTIGDTGAEPRVFARSVTAGGKTTECDNPVRLTKQDQTQLRTYEAEQLRTRDRLTTGTASKATAADSPTSSGGGVSNATQKGK